MRTTATTFTAYITKYALTSGIRVKQVTDCFHISPRMVSAGPCETYHAPDWSRTKSEALSRAEEMRQAKIASLEKSLVKFKAMKFTIPT